MTIELLGQPKVEKIKPHIFSFFVGNIDMKHRWGNPFTALKKIIFSKCCCSSRILGPMQTSFLLSNNIPSHRSDIAAIFVMFEIFHDRIYLIFFAFRTGLYSVLLLEENCWFLFCYEADMSRNCTRFLSQLFFIFKANFRSFRKKAGSLDRALQSDLIVFLFPQSKESETSWCNNV